MEEIKGKLKKSELKLRQIQQTKLKDLQRELTVKNRTINELNTKVQNLILGTDGDNGLKNSKSVTRNIGRRGELDISYSAKTPRKAFDNRRSTNSSRAAEYGNPRRN
tara:strand:+ start:1153 stop:1473 length:321 start_codon:yes stop_codon:yes gene_type:complete